MPSISYQLSLYFVPAELPFICYQLKCPLFATSYPSISFQLNVPLFPTSYNALYFLPANPLFPTLLDMYCCQGSDAPGCLATNSPLCSKSDVTSCPIGWQGDFCEDGACHQKNHSVLSCLFFLLLEFLLVHVTQKRPLELYFNVDTLLMILNLKVVMLLNS